MKFSKKDDNSYIIEANLQDMIFIRRAFNLAGYHDCGGCSYSDNCRMPIGQCEQWADRIDNLIKDITNEPEIKPWICLDHGWDGERKFQCPDCFKTIWHSESIDEYKYCPYCGRNRV